MSLKQFIFYLISYFLSVINSDVSRNHIIPCPPAALTSLTHTPPRYVYALYWATATVGTVGYGDVAAISVAEKVVSIVVILMGECTTPWSALCSYMPPVYHALWLSYTSSLGATLFAYFMGSMASIISARDSLAARMARKRAAVDEFLKHRHVPK